MDRHPRGLNVKTVWGSVLLGIVYSSLLYCHSTLTGTNSLDGIIGVLLGLYICSHPAANVVDILFFGRGARRRQFSSRRSVFFWLALNALILLIGWISIFLGTTRLIVRAD